MLAVSVQKQIKRHFTMTKKDAKTNLLEHSDAKVKLLGKYLSIYLNVLSRSTIDKIYLFDLFCGEGRYSDNGNGSPIVILETIKNHYFFNKKTCPNIEILFNDVGQSEIEPKKLKIERVKDFADKIFRPENVKEHYTKIDYNELVKKVIDRTNRLKGNERALIFIDPWGYKEINPEDIKNLIENKKSEVLLFLPIYFMSRFVEKSRDEEFKGGRAIRKFIDNLFGNIDDLETVKGQRDFIFKIQDQFKTYLNLKYVDTFKIERENKNLFCIFFFTNNKKGFEKMIQTKWSLDKKQGSEFKIGDELTLNLFHEIEISNYDKKVIEFVKLKRQVSNLELTDFGYENNFLPTHTKKILDGIKEQLIITSNDGKLARSYYLGDEKRNVTIKFI